MSALLLAFAVGFTVATIIGLCWITYAQHTREQRTGWTVWQHTAHQVGDPDQLDLATPEFVWPADDDTARRRYERVLKKLSNEH